MTRKEIAATVIKDGGVAVLGTVKSFSLGEDNEGRPRICVTMTEECIPTFIAKEDDPTSFVEGKTRWLWMYPGTLRAVLDETECAGLTKYIVNSEALMNSMLSGMKLNTISVKVEKEKSFTDPFREAEVEVSDHDRFIHLVGHCVLMPDNKSEVREFKRDIRLAAIR